MTATQRRGRPTGRAAKTQELLDASIEILRVSQPTTVRGVCYQLFTRKLLPDMSVASTRRVSRLLVDAREEGAVPWAWIVDDGRPLGYAGGWDNPDEFVRVMFDGYTRDRWQDQPERVIVVSEKGTIGNIVRSVTDRYGVVFAVYKGFGSATALHDLAERSMDDDRPLTLVYVGDHDPSGRAMVDADLPDRIERYGGRVKIEAVAVTPAQIERHRLPTFPVADKVKDPRYRWFLEQHGGVCAELDALPAQHLRSVVEAAIRSHIDLPTWERSGSTEAAERASMRDFFAAWPGRSE